MVVGQYFIWGRFVFKRWDRRRTAYAVTNQRALILRGESLQSVFLNQLAASHQTARADGSGSIEFGNPAGWHGRGYWANTGMDLFSPGSGVPAFYDIPEFAKVDRLVNQARSGSADPGQ